MNRAVMRRGRGPAAFRSPVIDRIVHVEPIVVLLLYLPPAVTGIVVSARSVAVAALLAWVAAGYLAWTLAEYWGHRLILHFEPERGIGARIHWLIHGLHHEYPTDPRRSIMSPLLSIPIVAMAWWVSVGLLGSPTAFAAGFIAGYLIYDFLHLYLHHSRPASRLLKLLHAYHMRHHFRDDTKGFGVSAPYWDLVFGTSGARTRHTGKAPPGYAPPD